MAYIGFHGYGGVSPGGCHIGDSPICHVDTNPHCRNCVESARIRKEATKPKGRPRSSKVLIVHVPY